jgi:hypothetical protein
MTYKGDILQVLHAVEWRRSGKEVEEWIRRQKTFVNTFWQQQAEVVECNILDLN